jgi:hypothetical protein
MLHHACLHRYRLDLAEHRKGLQERLEKRYPEVKPKLWSEELRYEPLPPPPPPLPLKHYLVCNPQFRLRMKQKGELISTKKGNPIIFKFKNSSYSYSKGSGYECSAKLKSAIQEHRGVLLNADRPHGQARVLAILPSRG